MFEVHVAVVGLMRVMQQVAFASALLFFLLVNFFCCCCTIALLFAWGREGVQLEPRLQVAPQCFHVGLGCRTPFQASFAAATAAAATVVVVACTRTSPSVLGVKSQGRGGKVGGVVVQPKPKGAVFEERGCLSAVMIIKTVAVAVLVCFVIISQHHQLTGGIVHFCSSSLARSAARSARRQLQLQLGGLLPWSKSRGATQARQIVPQETATRTEIGCSFLAFSCRAIVIVKCGPAVLGRWQWTVGA